MVELNLKQWLKADDFGNDRELTFVFTNEGAFSSGEYGDQFEIGVKSGLLERTWTMNPTSQRIVADKYGLDTKEWVGKTVDVQLVDQNVSGKNRKVLYAKAE